MDADYALADLAYSALIEIDINRTSPVPDYESAKRLYTQLLQCQYTQQQSLNTGSSNSPTNVFLS